MFGCPQTAYIDALTDVEVKTIGHHKVATVAGKEDAANKQVRIHIFVNHVCTFKSRPASTRILCLPL